MNEPGNQPQPEEQQIQWDIANRRAAWVANAQQADVLRTGERQKNSAHVKAEETAADDKQAVRSLKRLGIFASIFSLVFFCLLVLLGNSCFKAIMYKQHFDRGLVALAARDANRAQVEFSLAIQQEGRVADAHYYLAQAESERGSHGNALKAFQDAIALQPDCAKFYLARAALFMKAHNFNAAIEDCTAALKADPTFLDAYRLRAAADNHLGQYEKAIADSTAFLIQFRSNDVCRADAFSKRAFAEDQLKKYDIAIADYSEAIKCDSENGALFASRAVAYMHAQDWQKSVADCNRALELRPNDPVIFKVRGIGHAKLKLHKNSLDDLDTLVALHPTVDTYRTRGAQRLAAHDYIGSLQDFDYVLTAEPDDKRTSVKYTDIKNALQKSARKTAAVADAEPRAKMPCAGDLNKSEQELFNCGRKLFHAGDIEPAIAYFTAAVKANPNDVTARRYLAHAMLHSGRYTAAIKQYDELDKATTLTRKDMLFRARAYLGDNQPAGAVEVYRELVTANANDDLARTNLIKILLENDCMEEAAWRASEGAQQIPSQAEKYGDLFRQAVAGKAAKAKTM